MCQLTSAFQINRYSVQCCFLFIIIIIVISFLLSTDVGHLQLAVHDGRLTGEKAFPGTANDGS